MKSQQLAESAVLTPPCPPLIEIEEGIFKKLHTIAVKEQISIKVLASELLKQMLLYHRKEVKEIMERIKCTVSK